MLRSWRGRAWLMSALVACVLLISATGAFALEAMPIKDQDRVDITRIGELYEGRGDRLNTETAPSADGVRGRMAALALTPGTNPNYFVFVLSNPSPDRVTRILVAPRYNIVGSGFSGPDLDAARLNAITPSLGFRPERLDAENADVFRLTIEPGQTVTFIAELSSLHAPPRLTLWNPDALQIKDRNKALFNGILLGITGLLAIFLTAVFVANHKAIFPATALIAWSALAYFCIDFGFWHKLFPVGPGGTAVYRAAAEGALAFSFVLFLYVFLRIHVWRQSIKIFFWLWMLAQLGVIVLSVLDAQLAASLARMSMVAIAALGTVLIGYLAVRGQERALSLIPTWLLLLVWLFAGAMVMVGQLSGDPVVSGLSAGLVLILLLLGFTVTQFAFRAPGNVDVAQATTEPFSHRKLLAVDGAAASIWEWEAAHDEITVSPDIETALGLDEGQLSGPVDEFMSHMHPADRQRFRQTLWAISELNGGEMAVEFRMRRHDQTYIWYELRAAAAPKDDPKQLRCIGLMRDITDIMRAHERLMHDAVHDSLTSLPNRELFLDRLEGAVTRFREGNAPRPAVVQIDIDRFKNVNKTFGLVVGDSMLLTIARRLSRHLNPQDTLARIGGDQFAILVISESDPRTIGMMAERARRALRTPMKISGKEIVLTASIGIAAHDGGPTTARDLLREAEAAMYAAKRAGSDKIEVFSAEMKGEGLERLPLESELRRAIERRQISVLYQPIMRLDPPQLAGFEALLRWDHPKQGRLGADDFVPMAEEVGLINELGSYVLEQALEQARRWQDAMPRHPDPLFVSVNLSSRQLFRQDLAQEIRNALERAAVLSGTLKLEVTESLVMENPEKAVEVLAWLKSFGAGLALDDFGTGYSSLSYLHRFPFDTIKIDKSLIRDSSQNGVTPVILRSIVGLARELGKETVAEGVEKESEAEFLAEIGCDCGQGFFYGQPMSAKEVMLLLSALTARPRRVREQVQPHERPALALPSPGGRPELRPETFAEQAEAMPEDQLPEDGLPEDEFPDDSLPPDPLQEDDLPDRDLPDSELPEDEATPEPDQDEFVRSFIVTPTDFEMEEEDRPEDEDALQARRARGVG